VQNIWPGVVFKKSYQYAWESNWWWFVLICRHLDNLLLTDDGRLFHVDFAFILGRDPKPFPPPMKLCKEMLEAMGGADRYQIYQLFIKNWWLYLISLFCTMFCSQYYTRFKSYCCEAYNILRKPSNLILNLFYLMAGSTIPDIASDPEKGILKVSFFHSHQTKPNKTKPIILLVWIESYLHLVVLLHELWSIQLQEKFRLDMDDEACIHFFQDLINESVSALFPQMVETIHRWAQYWL